MTTANFANWVGNIADIGPIYPFAGNEGLFLIPGIAFWVGWLVWQIRGERKRISGRAGMPDAIDVAGDKICAALAAMCRRLGDAKATKVLTTHLSRMLSRITAYLPRIRPLLSHITAYLPRIRSLLSHITAYLSRIRPLLSHITARLPRIRVRPSQIIAPLSQIRSRLSRIRIRPQASKSNAGKPTGGENESGEKNE